MPKFEEILPSPKQVVAYRPGVGAAPKWAPEKMPKGFTPGGWIVKDGAKTFAMSKADFAKKYKAA